MKHLILTAALAISSILVPFAAQAGGIDHAEQRNVMQQHRIAAGIQQGQVTPREAVRLERGQEHVHRMERGAERDGVVTQREARRIDHAQNVQSHRIFRARHNRFGR